MYKFEWMYKESYGGREDWYEIFVGRKYGLQYETDFATSRSQCISHTREASS